MEVQFNELIEATLSDIHRKHRSVKMLFPTFDDRVKNVQLMGGIRLKEVDDDNWHFSVHSGTKKDVWYDCTLHFKNIQEVLEHYVKDRRLWVEDRSRVDLKKLAAIFVEKVDVQVFCSCLTGDTMIPLLDGRHLTMEQILVEFGTDKEFWVFASDENGDFVPAKATCLGKTNEVNALVGVTLDNDEIVHCTVDHLFRMRDGSYTRADQLKPGDSLMPMSNNHSVKSIRIITSEQNIPVYDLSVVGYHNFALSAGVFVHNCPAFLYYGPAYILGRPKYDAKYTDPEHRPPNKRNPKQYGATCKHFTNVLKALPFYTGTIAKWLRDFYARDIAGYEKEAMREFGWLRKAATVLGKKKARVEKPVKAPEKKPEPTKTEAEEEGQTQPETEGNTPPETLENERITRQCLRNSEKHSKAVV